MLLIHGAQHCMQRRLLQVGLHRTMTGAPTTPCSSGQVFGVSEEIRNPRTVQAARHDASGFGKGHAQEPHGMVPARAKNSSGSRPQHSRGRGSSEEKVKETDHCGIRGLAMLPGQVPPGLQLDTQVCHRRIIAGVARQSDIIASRQKNLERVAHTSEPDEHNAQKMMPASGKAKGSEGPQDHNGHDNARATGFVPPPALLQSTGSSEKMNHCGKRPETAFTVSAKRPTVALE